MASLLKLKKSSVSGKVPTPADLEYGEIALNYTDGLLFYKTSNNSIDSLGAQGIQGTIGTQGTSGSNGTQGTSGMQGTSGALVQVSLIDGTNSVTNNINNVTALRFDTDSGFDITDLGSGAVKVGMNSTFKTWQVDGQNDLVASGLDTIEFIAGSGIQITTNPNGNPKSITFSSTNTNTGTGLQGLSANYQSYTFTGDNTTTSYQVSSGINLNNVLVIENGITQTPSVDYTVNDPYIVFTTAPATGVVIQIRVLGGLGIQGATGTSGTQGALGTQGIAGSGSQGIQGIIGTQGAVGIQGLLGLQGSSGYVGQDGGQGIQGIQGPAGSGGGGGSSVILNLDGGLPNSIYGGISAFDAGGVTQ